jgi:uncharacterized membrane protein (DUF485 family)
MREIKILFAILLGLMLGAVFGFIAPFLVCYVSDSITQPAPGSGLITVGWVFCFITVPLFAIIGAIVSGKFANKKIRKLEE